jgi:alkanesulfonate monooxygenase SsuD/methylene tetrahydromethanopterin reductase-like flavin-dependent oxidoreductase (luciferase family)
MVENSAPLNISSLAFLTPGNYLDEDPFTGLDDTLRLFETGERLGFSGAWIRQRHLEHGVSAAAVFLAAASQRTSRIDLGVAVIPIGYESPFRLGEDLATADVLSRGRLQVGLSAGTPPHAELIGDHVFDGGIERVDVSHARVAKLRKNLSGEFLGDEDTVIQSPGNVQRPRLQPHSPGLGDRLWYGGGSLNSITWAAHNGFNILLGNLTSGEGTDDFHTAQLNQIAAYRAAFTGARSPRIAVGRVIVPTDSADAVSKRRYAEYAASRYERTLAPRGPRRTLFSLDLVGSSDHIVESLIADPALRELSELRLELPYEFSVEEYEQIIHDVIERVAPELGFTPEITTTGHSRSTAAAAGSPGSASVSENGAAEAVA